MKYKFIYFAFVKDDLKSAVNYYKKISPKLANDFLDRIEEGKIYILQNPFGDDVNYKDVRMHKIRKFPYHIHFKVLEDKKQILMIAIEFSKKDYLDFSDRL
jgi:hypothetical protein